MHIIAYNNGSAGQITNRDIRCVRLYCRCLQPWSLFKSFLFSSPADDGMVSSHVPSYWSMHTCTLFTKKNPSVIQAPLHTLFTRTIERKTLQLEVQCECMIDRRSRLMIGPRTWVASSPPWKTTSRPGQCVFSSSRKHCKMPLGLWYDEQKLCIFQADFFYKDFRLIEGPKSKHKTQLRNEDPPSALPLVVSKKTS